MKHVIRQAVPSDAPEIKSLEVDCGLSPWSQDAYARESVRQGSVMLVAVSPETERIEGFLILRLITINKVPPELCGAVLEAVLEAEILNIGVAQQARRRHLGYALLATALQKTPPDSRISLFLEVRRSNRAAQEFYTSAGFSVVGVRKLFYNAPAEDAILMTASGDKVLARFRGNGLVFEV